MAWGDVQSDKATEKQIQYAEILLERLHGDINYPIYSMNKREISMLIDDTKNKLVQKGIDWHEPNVPSTPFTTHHIQAGTIDTSRIHATTVDPTLATTPLRREDIQNAIDIMEENRLREMRMREEMRRRGLQQWSIGGHTIVEPLRNENQLADELEILFSGTITREQSQERFATLMKRLIGTRMTFNDREIVVSCDYNHTLQERYIRLRHRPTERVVGLTIEDIIFMDNNYRLIARKLMGMIDMFVNDVEEERERRMSQESRQLGYIERARNWFFGVSPIEPFPLVDPPNSRAERGDNNVNATPDSDRTI